MIKIEVLSQPQVIRKLNGWFTVFWLAWFIPAIVVKGLRDSVFLVALYSIWANLVTHYTAWLTSRVEVREEKIENIEETEQQS